MKKKKNIGRIVDIGCQMCQITLSKNTEKVFFKCKKKVKMKSYSSDSSDSRKSSKKIARSLKKIFWKEQFDTFDNRCDVLRAVFCDSCDVFGRLCDFVCKEVA